MVKLKRTTEYGLIALQHIARKHKSQIQNSSRLQDVISAREIADTYGLPFEITAKTLQRLRDSGFIQSAQGAHGGYALNKTLDQVTLAEFLEAMEGPQALVLCEEGSGNAVSEGCGCAYSGKCEVKGSMATLNKRVSNFLLGIKLSELCATDGGPS